MDKLQLKEISEKLHEVAEIIEKMPSEIRLATFNILSPYITGKEQAGPRTPANEDYEGIEKEDFFRSFDHDKPADNVRLIAGYLYSEYGTTPFGLEEISAIANDVGITIPERPDMTLKKATHNGKSMFTTSGRGQYKPTVHGEAYLKETYQVRKGNKKKGEQ